MYLFATIKQSQSLGGSVDLGAEGGSHLANGSVARGHFDRHRLDGLLKQTKVDLHHVASVGMLEMVLMKVEGTKR